MTRASAFFFFYFIQTPLFLSTFPTLSSRPLWLDSVEFPSPRDSNQRNSSQSIGCGNSHRNPIASRNSSKVAKLVGYPLRPLCTRRCVHTKSYQRLVTTSSCRQVVIKFVAVLTMERKISKNFGQDNNGHFPIDVSSHTAKLIVFPTTGLYLLWT